MGLFYEITDPASRELGLFPIIPILFGSRARGDARADSNVDLVVVEAEPFGPDRDRGAEETRLRRALAEFHAPKDILVYSLDEADRWRSSLNHVLARALREGEVLYERP